MQTKGEKLAETAFVSKRTEKEDYPVYEKVDLTDTDIETGKDVWCELYRLNGKGLKHEHLDDWTGQVYSDSQRVSIQKSIMEEHDIRPGEEYKLVLYEVADVDINEPPSTAVNGDTNDLKEQVEEIHEMVAEMYHTYKDAKE